MLEYTGNIILPGVLHHSLVHRKEMHMRESFGDRIKRLRVRKNMNQEQVASILKVSSKAISHYENNLREPSLDTLIGMADLFHVSVDYLLGIDYGRMIDVSGLSDKEINLIKDLIAEIREKNRQLRLLKYNEMVGKHDNGVGKNRG